LIQGQSLGSYRNGLKVADRAIWSDLDVETGEIGSIVDREVENVTRAEGIPLLLGRDGNRLHPGRGDGTNGFLSGKRFQLFPVFAWIGNSGSDLTKTLLLPMQNGGKHCQEDKEGE
jgi:hypothetical protein